MKVERTPITPADTSVSRSGPHPVPAAVSARSGDVSSVSQVVQTLRAEARAAAPGVRPDVIARIRQEMALGTFGGAADVERALNALLREL